MRFSHRTIVTRDERRPEHLFDFGDISTQKSIELMFPSQGSQVAWPVRVDRIVAINDAKLAVFMLQPAIDDMHRFEATCLELVIHHLAVERPIYPDDLAVDRIAAAGWPIVLGIDLVGLIEQIRRVSLAKDAVQFIERGVGQFLVLEAMADSHL